MAEAGELACWSVPTRRLCNDDGPSGLRSELVPSPTLFVCASESRSCAVSSCDEPPPMPLVDLISSPSDDPDKEFDCVVLVCILLPVEVARFDPISVDSNDAVD